MTGHGSRPVQWRPDRRATDPSRLAAYDVLRAVAADDAYANLVDLLSQCAEFLRRAVSRLRKLGHE